MIRSLGLNRRHWLALEGVTSTSPTDPTSSSPSLTFSGSQVKNQVLDRVCAVFKGDTELDFTLRAAH